MQGFDRARPLWEFVVVDGLADGRAGLIIKIHHAITDGVGGVKIAMHLFDLERDAPPTAGPMPDAARDPRDDPARAHASTRSITSAAASPASPGARLGTSPAWPRPRPATRRAPLGSCGATLASVGRMLAPATEPLSPIMTGRSLSVHFDTITVPLAELKAAAKRADGKLNDAFVAGIAGGLRRYHERHGRRRRRAAHVDADQHPQRRDRRPRRQPVRAGSVRDPARRSTTRSSACGRSRELVTQQRGEPALALAEPLAGVLYRLPTSVTTGVFGSMLRASTSSRATCPACRSPCSSAGAAWRRSSRSVR